MLELKFQKSQGSDSIIDFLFYTSSFPVLVPEWFPTKSGKYSGLTSPHKEETQNPAQGSAELD